MNFEYDENKSQSNLAKHGIDFVQAQELWNDHDLLEIPNIRIISVRRSRTQEVALYERRDKRQGI